MKYFQRLTVDSTRITPSISYQEKNITPVILPYYILCFYTCLFTIELCTALLLSPRKTTPITTEYNLIPVAKVEDQVMNSEVVHPSTEHLLESKIQPTTKVLSNEKSVAPSQNAGLVEDPSVAGSVEDPLLSKYMNDIMQILKEIYAASSERLLKINNKDLTFMDNDTVLTSLAHVEHGMDTPLQLLKQIISMNQQGDKAISEAWAEYVDNATTAFEAMEKENKMLKLQAQRDNFLMQSQFEGIISDMEKKLSHATNEAVSASSKAKEMVEEVQKLRTQELETIQHKMDLEKQIQEAVQKHEKAKREVKFEVSYQRPSYWAPAVDDYKQFAVDAASDEFAFVYELMNATLRKHRSGVGLVNGADPAMFQITSLNRVHNIGLWKKYCHQKQCIKEAHKDVPNLAFSKYLQQKRMLTPLLDPSVNEYWLFHGTSWNVIQILAQTGYDTRVASVSGMFGSGFYLAENSSKSNQYIPCPKCTRNTIFSTGKCICGDNRDHIYGMVLYRALLGNGHIASQWDRSTYQGTSANPVRRPPLTNDGVTPFDCVVGESIQHGGNELEFREIILYENNMAYPEYIISFKRLPQQLDINQGSKTKAQKFLSMAVSSTH